MAYLLNNICTKNYWNQTTIVEIIVGGWVEELTTWTESAFRKKVIKMLYGRFVRVGKTLTELQIFFFGCEVA